MGWWNRSVKEVDLEAGGGSLLYPGLSHGENQLRWGFIRKVYGIVAAEIVLTTIVSAFTVLYTPLNHALLGSTWLAIALAFLPFIFLCPLYIYKQKHPLNFVFLGLFVASISLPVGVACANTQEKIVLEALILTSAVVLSLTGYTFWASKRGKDFSFIGPFLSAALMILVVFGLIQMFFPLGRISYGIYSGLGALIFAGYIVYDTDNLIKRFDYDEYIWASVILYLDILNLFLHLLNLLNVVQSN